MIARHTYRCVSTPYDFSKGNRSRHRLRTRHAKLFVLSSTCFPDTPVTFRIFFLYLIIKVKSIQIIIIRFRRTVTHVNSRRTGPPPVPLKKLKLKWIHFSRNGSIFNYKKSGGSRGVPPSFWDAKKRDMIWLVLVYLIKPLPSDFNPNFTRLTLLLFGPVVK